MRVLFVIFLLLLGRNVYSGIPDSVEIVSWEDREQVKDRNTVRALSFHRMKLVDVPNELENYPNLEYLILRKNRLQQLPDFLVKLKQLKYLDLSQNRFVELPELICELGNLEELILNRNELETLPSCINNSVELSYIDLWDNPIRELPLSMVGMSGLRKVDLSGIKFSPTFQQSWRKRMSWVEFVFEEPCDCME